MYGRGSLGGDPFFASQGGEGDLLTAISTSSRVFFMGVLGRERSTSSVAGRRKKKHFNTVLDTPTPRWHMPTGVTQKNTVTKQNIT